MELIDLEVKSEEKRVKSGFGGFAACSSLLSSLFTLH